jgi:drug/metabolite transporter (DMT)-like permease
MFWTLLTIAAALGQSSKDALAKRLSGKLNSYTLSVGIAFCIVLCVTPSLFFNQNFIVNLTPLWLLVFLFTGVMFAITQVLMNKAFAISDLSVTIPILNFSTLWTLVLSPFLLGEFPNSIQLTGIVLITIGAYILKLTKETKSFLEPLKHLLTDRGSQYMLIVSFIWGLDTILGKIGARETNAYFGPFPPDF